tara:strand:+ start:179 stop:313 length:135 start_codon:yes stop_codon:yes gene_type:complete
MSWKDIIKRKEKQLKLNPYYKYSNEEMNEISRRKEKKEKDTPAV